METANESIMSKLRDHRLALEPRDTGKTTTLMHFIHESTGGDCIVATLSDAAGNRFAERYARIFPADKRITFIAATNWDAALSRMCAGPRKWVVDEVWPEVAAMRVPELKLLTCLGGVGTPMCMDIHSR